MGNCRRRSFCRDDWCGLTPYPQTRRLPLRLVRRGTEIDNSRLQRKGVKPTPTVRALRCATPAPNRRGARALPPPCRRPTLRPQRRAARRAGSAMRHPRTKPRRRPAHAPPWVEPDRPAVAPAADADGTSPRWRPRPRSPKVPKPPASVLPCELPNSGVRTRLAPRPVRRSTGAERALGNRPQSPAATRFACGSGHRASPRPLRSAREPIHGFPLIAAATTDTAPARSAYRIARAARPRPRFAIVFEVTIDKPRTGMVFSVA